MNGETILFPVTLMPDDKLFYVYLIATILWLLLAKCTVCIMLTLPWSCPISYFKNINARWGLISLHVNKAFKVSAPCSGAWPIFLFGYAPEIQLECFSLLVTVCKCTISHVCCSCYMSTIAVAPSSSLFLHHLKMFALAVNIN